MVPETAGQKCGQPYAYVKDQSEIEHVCEVPLFGSYVALQPTQPRSWWDVKEIEVFRTTIFFGKVMVKKYVPNFM
jgi:hypothetical protein